MGMSMEGEDAVAAAVSYAHGHLSGADWGEALPVVLARLGGALSAGRAFVFSNVRDQSGRLWMDLRGEWTAASTPPIFQEPANHLHPYAPDFARWIDLLGSNQVVEGRIDEMPAAERTVLAAEDVRSTVVAPIFVGSEWWGFVGIDACDDAIDRDVDQVAAVRNVADALGRAVAGDRDDQIRRFDGDRFRSVVEFGPAVSYIDAPDGSASTSYISPQIEALLGYTPQDWYDDDELWLKLLHPDDRARAVGENDRHNETCEPFRLEYRLFHRDGHVVWVHDEARMVRDEQGAARHSLGVLMDITERRRSDDAVAFLAYHDELTGLPSRSMFEELLELSVARAIRHDGSVAVLCVDVDDFRLVNDSLGHRRGDRLLRMVADRLREATRETDLVARRGGDQFLMLLSDLEREAAGDMDAAVVRAEAAAQRVHASMAAPFEVEGTEVYLSVSLGISLYPQDADEAGSLQRNAEAAMYESKKAGPAGYVVSSRGTFDSAAKLRFVTRLRKAVESQRWTLLYQPIVDLETDRMKGVEALIRWVEPDGTMVSPAEFIPLAEDLGLIETIGAWVVGELVYQAQAWRDLDMDLEIGFNLSPRQFWQPDLAPRIVSKIEAGGIDPSQVVVEITESSAMIDPDRAQEILWELHLAGLRIAVDDFGTGYSSLSRLRDMPVDVLKIDRSFVSGADRDPQAASMVSAFLALSHGLGMTTLAEGIETDGELAFLRQHGCELGQGYVFSRPVPPEEIIAFAYGGVPVRAPVRTNS